MSSYIGKGTAMKYSILSVLVGSLLLVGCGGEDKNISKEDSAPPVKTEVSPVAALKQLEQSGDLPILNRDSTISGVDANNNGVRDDIDQYVNSLPDTATQKKALLQVSKSLNIAMTVNVNNQNQVIDAANNISGSIKCIYSLYTPEIAPEKQADMEKFTVNTTERVAAYEQFNTAVSGSSFVLPQGDGCEN